MLLLSLSVRDFRNLAFVGIERPEAFMKGRSGQGEKCFHDILDSRAGGGVANTAFTHSEPLGELEPELGMGFSMANALFVIEIFQHNAALGSIRSEGVDSSKVAGKGIHMLEILARIILKARTGELSLHPVSVKGMLEEMKLVDGGLELFLLHRLHRLHR